MMEIKCLVTKVPILTYYDQNKEVIIQCEASSTELVSVLLQEGIPLTYASRELSST